jgi:hypothetical protein
MFIISGLLSLAIIALYVRALQYLLPPLVKREKTRIAWIIAGIYITFNILYFSNIIPPLPLALKDGGVYHSILHNADGTYTLTEEPVEWWNIFERYSTTFHAQSGEVAVVWSAVFAPSGLSTVILHEWQRYDDATHSWLTTNTERFPIIGGRDGGYRGYSIKAGITPGPWRVNVITQYGQLIGRISFTVVATASSTPLIQITD